MHCVRNDRETKEKKTARRKDYIVNIIFGIYVAGSFTGAMLSAWMIKKRRVVTGIIYGAVYITVLLVIATIMKKQAPDSSNNIAMSVAACVAAGAFGGFFSP